MTLNQKITTAKALRNSFNQTQSELIKSSYMGDEYLLKQIRAAQDEYRLFHQLVDEIKDLNEEEYEKHILGV
tara:strand:+ start:110 stop:325 length:216 start_codon:yes stop_codon:yes gene_type:complete